MIAGDRLEYSLGAVTDPSNLPVTATLSTQYKWLVFDAKALTITVPEKATDAKISGDLGK